MDGARACRLSGSAEGSSRAWRSCSSSCSTAQRGAEPLERVESLPADETEEPVRRSDDGSEEDEAPENCDRNRLLHYWQDVGREHRVHVPTDMAVPIHQLTTNNDNMHNREKVPFVLISSKECRNVFYEKRYYGKSNWACIAVCEDTYEQSICLGFMKLMRYICQQNSSGSYLGMTIPIVTVVRLDESRSALSKEVTVAYYLPLRHQAQPPHPSDPDIVMEEWPATILYSRAFSGATTERTILSEIIMLSDVLELPDTCLRNSFIVAGYTNPAAPNRQNELWILEQP